jgi:Putative phage tail protein
MRALKGNLAHVAPPATGLQLSSCCYGHCPPLVYGLDRITPKLIYSGDFQSHSSGGFIGSLLGNSSTTYTANLDMLLGFAPMEGVYDVWYGGNWLYVFTTVNVFNFASVGAATTLSGNCTLGSLTNPIIGLYGVYLAGIPYSETYSDFVYPGETNNFTLSGTGIVPLYNNHYAAPNNGSWASTGQPYATINTGTFPQWAVYFPNAISTPFSICVIFAYDVNEWSGSGLTNAPPLIAAQLQYEPELGDGSSGQPIVYPEFVGCAGVDVNLGSSPTLPDWNLRVKGMFGIGYPVTQSSIEPSTVGTTDTLTLTTVAGDCNPADIIFDLISSGNAEAWFGINACWNHGCGFSGVVYDPSGGQDNQYQYSRYGSLAIDEDGPIAFVKMRNYCMAYSIFVSGSITEQTSAGQVIKDLAEIANCAPCWNGAALDFIPYCEVSNFGNGTNYVAPTASGPLWTLDRTWLLTTKVDKEGSSNPKPPVVYPSGVPDDNFNSLAISIKDRTGTTNNNTIILTDAADVTRQGPMPQGSRSWPWIQNPSMAIAAGWAVLRHNVIVNRAGTFAFSLPAQFSVMLSLMDLVLLDEPTISPDLIPVRITKISENEQDMSIDCEAELFLYGASVPAAPGTGVSGVIGSGAGGSGTGVQNTPGAVNTPIIFEAIPAIANVPEIWIGVSGGASIIGAITAAFKVSGGSGYQAATVTVTGGGGSGCLMQAVIVGGQVSNLIITAAGSGYTSTPTIAIVDPTGSGSGASYTAVVGILPVYYGGCLVYMSTDGGNTYNPVESIDTGDNTIMGNQTMGTVFSTNYPSHVDPDTVDTLTLDMSESREPLNTFTTQQQNAFLSLCYLAGGGTVAGPNGTTLTIPYELIAYASETLSAPERYALGPPIRRGVYGTPVAAHNVGTPFSYILDGTIFRIALPNSLIGVTLYFKFLSFNTNGAMLVGLPDATAYSFTPTGQVGFLQQTYTIAPYPTVYQGQSGGWPGVDGSSSGWTNTSDVYFPTITATFASGKVLNYAARDSGVAFSGSIGQQVWVTIYDPTQAGEPNGVASLSTYADTNQTRWNSPGYIRIGTFVIAASGGSGGGGGSSGSTNIYPISCYEGDPTLTAPVASQILLSHQIPAAPALTNVALAVGLPGSVATCKTAPTANVTITIYRTPLGGSPTAIGTINFAAGVKTGTFTFASAVTLNPGDIVDFIFQSSADSTFAGVFWNVVGTRS